MQFPCRLIWQDQQYRCATERVYSMVMIEMRWPSFLAQKDLIKNAFGKKMCINPTTYIYEWVALDIADLPTDRRNVCLLLRRRPHSNTLQHRWNGSCPNFHAMKFGSIVPYRCSTTLYRPNVCRQVCPNLTRQLKDLSNMLAPVRIFSSRLEQSFNTPVNPIVYHIFCSIKIKYQHNFLK